MSGQLPFWRSKLPFSFFGSYKNRVGRDPGGQRSRWAEIQMVRDPSGPRSSGPRSSGSRLSRHPSRCTSQWRMVPLGLPEAAYKGPNGSLQAPPNFGQRSTPFGPRSGPSCGKWICAEMGQDGENECGPRSWPKSDCYNNFVLFFFSPIPDPSHFNFPPDFREGRGRNFITDV